MSEIQRDARASDGASRADRDAKIEQLLLLGLDHYFSAQYEQAINVWTRVLFLDRNHQRARAYIERARRALAERQRESEELLHNGVAAFHRGEGDEARRLLQAAIDGGAPPDEALAVLERLNRLEAPALGDLPSRTRAESRPLRTGRSTRASRSGLGIAAASAVLVMGLALGGYATAAASHVDWRTILQFSDPPAASVHTVSQDALPLLPRRGEMALGRARTLAAGGHLHEALDALDHVSPTDPQKAEADRLRADVQRQLLALTPLPPASPRRDTGKRRVP
jgi:tetratricopeptide (TPR) repeat protein